MFHLAPPDVNGFGVTTCTPGLTRSCHVRIFLGLPSRTTKQTTERVTMPWYWLFFQFLATKPRLTSVVMSGSSESMTTSALRPSTIARAWSPDAP